MSYVVTVGIEKLISSYAALSFLEIYPTSCFG